MLFHPRSKNRPVELGPYPLETLPRDERIVEREAKGPTPSIQALARGTGELSGALKRYQDIFAGFADGEPAPAIAPLPDDLKRRAADIKGGAYFMDADQVGICRIADNCWLGGEAIDGHDRAVVILVTAVRVPEPGNPARQWVENAGRDIADTRAAEIAVCIAGHIRMMGFAAKAHVVGNSQVDCGRLAVLASLAIRRDGRLVNPYIDGEFALAAVTTSYQVATDLPLAEDQPDPRGLAYWWGMNGAVSGRERNRRSRRATHLSRYPMETVQRIDRPTTLILDDEVPRVPKRAAFFQRALHGDLGDKAKRERSRFAFKTPFSHSLLGTIRSMVPFQDGELGSADASDLADPALNAKAIKSLSYALGSDLTGICEIPPYAWFSHREDGTPIDMYHRYAVVMLIDQGYDTMEGASGDDWVSGAQSMRAYHARCGNRRHHGRDCCAPRAFPARSQTNADSDVLHIPLVLWAGLGELSRIGELVLNPFLGPRFKICRAHHRPATDTRQTG